MAKKVILEPGRTFSEFSLLTDYTTKNCNLNNINLKSNLGKLELGIPFLSAAMTSVTGYEMALALGKEGGLEFYLQDFLSKSKLKSLIKSKDMKWVL